MKKSLVVIILTVIIAVSAIEITASIQGINGVVLTSTLGAICAIPSWFVSKHLERKKLNGRK